MALFRSHREAARATNRTIFGFFVIVAVCALIFIAIIAVHYLLGWW